MPHHYSRMKEEGLFLSGTRCKYALIFLSVIGIPAISLARCDKKPASAKVAMACTQVVPIPADASVTVVSVRVSVGLHAGSTGICALRTIDRSYVRR